MKPAQLTVRTVFVTYLALMILLGLTALASIAPLGEWKGAVSLFIAAIKTALVFLFFMQLRYTPGLVRIFAVTGFFWLAIMGSLTFADYATRGWLHR